MKRLIALAIGFALLTSAAAVPASAEVEKASYENKEVTGYLFDLDTKKTFDCLFRTDLNLPYISAEDYLDQLFTVDFSTSENSDGTYTVYNKNGSMVVNPEKDTVHFNFFEKLVFYDTLPILESEQAPYLKDDEFVLDDNEKKGLDLNLGEYNIDITAADGNVYFPLTTLADIFGATYHSAVYLDGCIYFTHVLEDEVYYNEDSLCDTLERDKTLIEYTYNEMCFAVDNFYGRPPKSEMSESIAGKGLDKTLDEYSELTASAKKLLLSGNKVDFCYGLLYLDSLFDDGGHTYLSGGMMMSLDRNDDSVLTAAIQESFSDIDDERISGISDYILNQQESDFAAERLRTLRKECYSDCETVNSWDEASLIRQGKTVIFVFDSFKDAVVEPFKWSLDYAKDNGVENFVVDLTVNSGGSSAVAVYMLSIMTGDGSLPVMSSNTGITVTETAEIDKNLDGEFDDKDNEVKYDFNYAILTTRFSFSCGNLMPCLAKQSGVAILGETSGGGTCMLSKLYYAEPFYYAMSNTLTMLDRNGNNIDSGAEPDVELVTETADGGTDYTDCYDIDKIDAAIKSVEADKPEQTESESIENDTEKKPGDGDSDGGIPVFVWIIVCAGAAAVIAAAAVIIIRRRKNKKDTI